MCCICFFVILPLNLVGTILGRNLSGQPNFPCRVNAVPRPIPEKKWYVFPFLILNTTCYLYVHFYLFSFLPGFDYQVYGTCSHCVSGWHPAIRVYIYWDVSMLISPSLLLFTWWMCNYWNFSCFSRFLLFVGILFSHHSGPIRFIMCTDSWCSCWWSCALWLCAWPSSVPTSSSMLKTTDGERRTFLNASFERENFSTS